MRRQTTTDTYTRFDALARELRERLAQVYADAKAAHVRLLAPHRYMDVQSPNAAANARAFRAEIAGQHWTQAEHAAAARWWLQAAAAMHGEWCAAIADAREAHGDGNGVLISGVYRDHFPEWRKATLRALAHGQTFATDASIAHWRAAGRRLETWRRERDRVFGE